MELLQYWKILRKRMVAIILIVLIFVFGAVFYVQRQEPIYRTTTTLFISPSTLGSTLPYQMVYAIAPLANTYSEYMRTRSFAQLVADKLDIQISDSEILNALSMEYVKDTQIFRITAAHSNPEVAQKLANTTAEMLIEANGERQRQEQQSRIDAQRSPEAKARQQQMTELTAVLQDELTYYNEQIAVLEDEIRALQQGPSSAEVTQRVLDLREQLLQLRTERVDVLASLSQTQGALAGMTEEPVNEVDTAVIVDPALLPTTPVGQNLMQPLVAAAMAGLALGIGLAWLLEYVDYTVKTPEELDEVYGITTQGAIGAVASAQGAARRTHSLVTLTEPRSPTAEAFRALRTSIRMAGTEKPVRSVLVTSAGPGEGKTFVASNLAISFAQEGKRVILVDLDLRKPQVHASFNLRREPGFSDLVVDHAGAPADYFQATPVANLRVLTCGTIPPHPSELLGSPRAAELIRQLYEMADVLVYDTAPAATVTDAILVAPQVDGVLQVVLAGGTRRDLVRRTKALLERSGARILGPVLNRVQADDLGYYANYYYYGGYYHEDDKKAGGRGMFGRKRHKSEAQPARSVTTSVTASGNGNGKGMTSKQQPAGDEQRQPVDGG